MKKSSQINLRQHPLTRFLHYAFLIPFLLCLRALLVNYSTLALIVYLAGFILVLVLIVYGNRHPLVQIQPNRLALFLNYNNKAEYFPWQEISGYTRISPVSIQLHSGSHQPISIKLGKTDVGILILKLESENIHAT